MLQWQEILGHSLLPQEYHRAAEVMLTVVFFLNKAWQLLHFKMSEKGNNGMN